MLCWISQLSLTVCNPWSVAHQSPLSMGIVKTRILECVAKPVLRGFSQPRDQTQVFCIAGRFFTIWATREAPRPHMLWGNRTRGPQPENPWVATTILCATSKTWCSQVKKNFFLKKIPFHSTQKERTLQTPCSQTSGLQNSETVHFCCLSLQSVVAICPRKWMQTPHLSLLCFYFPRECRGPDASSEPAGIRGRDSTHKFPLSDWVTFPGEAERI